MAPTDALISETARITAMELVANAVDLWIGAKATIGDPREMAARMNHAAAH